MKTHWQNRQRSKYILFGVLLCVLLVVPVIVDAELMIVGNDEKVVFKPTGATVTAPGRDTISIINISANPEQPQITTNLKLMNSIYGPPTNLAITPDECLALVACSMDDVQKGTEWKLGPDNKLYVIDLTTTPPSHIDTVEVGKQPSGLAINRAGDLALIANLAGKSVSVLSIEDKTVKLIDTVDMGEGVAAIAITPDSRRALAVKRTSHKVALLEIEGNKVTYNKYDMPVGFLPYNVQITPDGKIVLQHRIP